MRYIKDVFIDYYDPTIEGASPTPWRLSPAYLTTEEYRRTVKIDGELSSVSRLRALWPLLLTSNSCQLEILDTAGAEQFTNLNEVYIKVLHVYPVPLLRMLTSI